MTHPGLPWEWAYLVWTVMGLLYFWMIIRPSVQPTPTGHLAIARMPVLGSLIRYTSVRPAFLVVTKLIFVTIFLVIIAAGLYGTPFPERNAATILTWNLWWTGLVLLVVLTGSAWCSICPWNTLANWLVKRKLWRRAGSNSSLNLRLPKSLRTVWPALFLLIALTWLELGAGVTTDPFATAILALMMVVLATASLAIFERNGFCNYFCPVGRTVGFYAQLAPIELRPIDPGICARCTTLECYNGSSDVDPCPTRLVMGRLKQNTYCTSCGNCARSCHDQNVAWRLRSPSAEAIQDARPHWDEAWFIIALLALTGFHGLTMLSDWQAALVEVARALGTGEHLLVSFTGSLIAALALPALVYGIFVWFVWRIGPAKENYRTLFCRFAFVALPLAFAYHLAHNLNHLLREGSGLWTVLQNPLGIGTLPASMAEKHMRMMEMIVSPGTLHAIQALLLITGVVVANRVIQRRSYSLATDSPWQRRAMVMQISAFSFLVTAFHLWLLMQPMAMRL
ncbi:MAG: 4Fe-4S binding protein [Alphaproteobacteria bacterium]|nr:4Fe-4S binding protein [Alphaproteobacteria bacterium]MDP7229617.1 4Fe-4S binding protein [Alphaproteobacteria bacterium]